MPVKKILATGLAVTIAAASLVSTADARHRHRHHGGEAFAAGVLGFTAGALLSGAFAPRYSHRYYYDDYPPRYYYDEPRYYRDDYAPAPRIYYRQAPVYRPDPGYYYDPCNVPVGSSKPANAMC